MTEAESMQALENTSCQPLTEKLDNFKLGLSNIIYQVSIAKDGNLWCALIGQDLQSGISGFGETPQDALRDLANKMGQL